MWETKDNRLYREFKFKDFNEAFDFMQKVARVAAQMDHHPTWTNTYNRVEIWLSTHSAGKITDKDHQLAEKIDRIFSENA